MTSATTGAPHLPPVMRSSTACTWPGSWDSVPHSMGKGRDGSSGIMWLAHLHTHPFVSSMHVWAVCAPAGAPASQHRRLHSMAPMHWLRHA